MKIITFLVFSTGLAASYAAAAPAPASDPGVAVKYYPTGLPAELYPGAELTTGTPPSFVVNAPGVNDQTSPVGAVFACSDPDFTGRCVYIKAALLQCVNTLVVPTVNDVTSSVTPARPWGCRLFADIGCSEAGGSFRVRYPGISDLSLTQFDNKISSFRCAAQ